MHLIVGSLVAGAIAGTSARQLTWRPLLKSVIKGGIRLQRKALEASTSVRAEATRLVVDAREELDGSQSAAHTGDASS